MTEWTIRLGTEADLEKVTALEALCFPPEEAAGKESFRGRLQHFPECFWLLERNGVLLALIDGMATEERELRDEMFDHPELHSETGSWQMLFGVMTAPEYQGRGYASALMEQVIRDCRQRGRKGIVLTAKDRLLPFYERFGFRSEGISASEHGGAVWYSMRLQLTEEEKA